MKNKNIIILGVPRSGKSTLARMLHEKYNYSIISIDSFISAFQESFPSMGIKHANTEEKFKLLPQFLYSYMNKIINEFPNDNFVLEGWHVYPKDILRLFGNTDLKIICLGYPRISCNEAFYFLRKYEEENSYTKLKTDDKVKEIIANAIEYSKILREQCINNNIKFFDTSFDRENVLKEALKYLIS